MPKKEIRIIGWDDCAFTMNQKSVRIIGTVFRGGLFLDGMLSTEIEKDGMDATDKIVTSILHSRHYEQLSLIMTDGISFGGLNIIDIKYTYKETGLPVIAVLRKKPNKAKFLSALKKFPDYGERKKAVEAAGKIHKYGKIYFQKSGLKEKECQEVLDITCIRSFLPEPIRVAHIIASGLSRQAQKGSARFESRGRA